MRTLVTKKVTGGMGAGMSSTYASRLPDDLDNLTVGALTLAPKSTSKFIKFTSDTAIFDATLDSNEEFQFALQTNAGIVFSPMIDITTLRWTKTSHVSYNAKVLDVGYSVTNSSNTWSMPTVSDNYGAYATIKVLDLDVPFYQTNAIKIASHQLADGDTEATIHTKLYNQLKEYEGTYFATITKQTSGGNYGYTFTGITGKNFKVITEGVLEGSTQVVNTALAMPSGEGADILAQEKLGAVKLGYNPTENVHSESYTAGFMADVDVNYDVFILEWYNRGSRAIEVGTRLMQQLLIAVPVNGESDTADKISDQLEDALQAIADQTKKWDATS